MNDDKYLPFNGRQPGETDDGYAERRGQYIEELKGKLAENTQQQYTEGRGESDLDRELRRENRRVGKGLFGWLFGSASDTPEQSFSTDQEANRARAAKDLPKQPAPEVTQAAPGEGEWFLDDDGLMKRR